MNINLPLDVLTVAFPVLQEKQKWQAHVSFLITGQSVPPSGETASWDTGIFTTPMPPIWQRFGLPAYRSCLRANFYLKCDTYRRDHSSLANAKSVPMTSDLSASSVTAKRSQMLILTPVRLFSLSIASDGIDFDR